MERGSTKKKGKLRDGTRKLSQTQVTQEGQHDIGDEAKNYKKEEKGCKTLEIF